MPLRSFTDQEGAGWRVWSVVPDPNAASTLDDEYRAGWLCFERLAGGERRRLALTEVPAAWDALPDERLDLLRRVAAPSAPSLADTTEHPTSPSSSLEDDTRSRPSKPRTVIGGAEDELR